MAWIISNMFKARFLVPTGVGGTGYYVSKKIDELEEYTNTKWDNLRKITSKIGDFVEFTDEQYQKVQTALVNALKDEQDPVKREKILQESRRLEALRNYNREKIAEPEPVVKKAVENSFQAINAGEGAGDSSAPSSSPDGNSGNSPGSPNTPPSIKELLREMDEIQKNLQSKTEELIATQKQLDSVNADLEAQKTLNSNNQAKFFDATKKIDQLEKMAYEIELKYQKERSKLEQDVADLRRQVLFERENRRNKNQKMKSGIKRQLVDIYSEVLDTLASSGYSSSDQLPRIVVVGDQSAGKTSVLESIAKARLFPRGAGKMMTKTPIKVTLCEGPRSEAYFSDNPEKIYNLSQKQQESDLREEIEKRMNKSCQKRNGTVSEIPVSLNVSGPGVRRMVLVDLPGVIATVTNEMNSNTKTDIENMIKKQLANPNAIILCIQDGSVDAERSIVTDLVSKIDPKGQRTIFVLTKVDKAENQGTSSSRVKQILDGKLFPMKALGYHAVVTGRGESSGNAEDSIDEIRNYEEEFFQKSELFRKGLLKPSQLTSSNLSMTVSDLFWRMIKDTIEQQSDAFKATKFNLETEWKNSFPRIRELDRYELFEKAKNEILDKVLELPATVQPKEWENELLSRLWEQVSHHVVEHIFLPAAIKSDSSADFNTQVDIKLKQWADNMLPKMASEVAKQMLLERFSKVLVPYDTKLSSSEPLIGTSHHTAHFDPQSQNNERNKYDPIFDLLREQVLSESIKRHKWDEDYYKTLRVIQLNALEDRSVQDGNEWSGAINFIEKNLGKRLAQTDRKIEEMIGKGAIGSYYHWYTNSEEQKTNMAIKKMLTPLLTNRDKFAENPNLLSEEEVLTVRKSLELQRKDIKLPDSNQEAYKMIRAMWYQLYRRQFLVQKIEHCKGCRRQYYSYKNEVDNGILAAEVRKGSSLGLGW